MQNSQNNNNIVNDDSDSIVLNLESLTAEYDNLLIKYNQAIADYSNYLLQETETPCGLYNSDSKGIDQRCYDFIWKSAGCGNGTLHPQANWSWQQSQTMDGLINDAYYWATQTDYNHRMGCYGNPGNPYTIIGVGTDGRLYSRQGLDAPWEYINDDSNGNIVSICTGADGKTIFCTNVAYEYWYKTSWDAPHWQGPIPTSCCNIGVAQGQDGTLIGVGTDHTLWSNYTSDINSNHYKTASPSEWIAQAGVAIAPDGSIFVVGYDNFVYKKNSYKNLPSQTWQRMDTGWNTCCVKSITIAPDGTFIGVGTDDQLYSKTNYKDLSTQWIGHYNPPSCCVVSITTVANPNYNVANYNTSTQPNYNVQQQPLIAVQGQSFWGTGPIGQQTINSVGECQALCSSTANCSGATFNPDSKICMLRTGEGTTVPSSSNDYAIIPKGLQLLNIANNLNLQLTNINQQILNKINDGQSTYNIQVSERQQKTKLLEENYKKLREERNKIEKTIHEYESLDKEQSDGNIAINQNYYSFLLLLALSVFVFIILYKFSGNLTTSSITTTSFQTGGELGINVYYLVFALILCILFIKYFFM